MYIYVYTPPQGPAPCCPAGLGIQELGEPGLAEGAVHVAVLCGSC